ncbi:MAG: low molecular weight protein-tyrosine-phosphatase [Actinomycetota bacterium]
MTEALDLLPPKRRADGSPYRIAVVCLGNICRSPMAHVVLEEKLARAGLDDRVEVVSAGTGDWHVGGPMDRRAAAALASAGYDGSQHRASQFESHWHDEADLVLAMDGSNHADLSAIGEPEPERLRMFRDFDPRARGGDRDVPDPYYGGDDGFTHVLATVERTADALVAALERVLETQSERHLGGA